MMISSLATICVAATIGVNVWSGNQENDEAQQLTQLEHSINETQGEASGGENLEVVIEAIDKVDEEESFDDDQEEQVSKNEKIIYVTNKNKTNNGGTDNDGGGNGGNNNGGGNNGGVEDMIIPTFTNVSVHDPAIIKAEDSYYVFGSHLGVAKTDDWMNWTLINSGVKDDNPIIPNIYTELVETFAWAESDTLWA